MATINDPLGVLDRDLLNYDVAYQTFVTDHRASKQVIIDWGTAYFAGPPSEEWVEHNRWRASVERTWWKTLRRALQDSAPLPQDPPPPGALRRLAFDGSHCFVLDGGEKWTWIGCTDFRLFKRWLDGETIDAVLAQRAALGYNICRVLGQGFWNDQVYRLIPREYGERYYEELPRFADKLASYGLRFELVAFAGTYGSTPDVMASDQEQVAYWNRLGQTLAPVTNVVVELVNEWSHPTGVNRINLGLFEKLPGVLCAKGSGTSQEWPLRYGGAWDYETGHYNDAFEWQRKVGHNTMEWFGGTDPETGVAARVPGIGDENTRAIDHFSDPVLAYDAAAGAALLCAGSTFHSQNGKLSFEWSGQELACAQAWADGARSVPLEFQRGAYIHRDDLEGDGILRAYERRLNDGRGHVVRIHHA